MSGWGELAREYEARRFPPTRRLDLHGEGPAAARERALRWIQSRAHEAPGDELLLVVERGRARHRPPTPVRRAVESLLRELEGRLIEWWQIFGEGSLALRIADRPTMFVPEPAAPPAPPDDGRTAETAGAAVLATHHDIPAELLETARLAAELRRSREGLSVGLLEVLLRRIWIEAQADAMERAMPVETALDAVLAAERRRIAEEG